MRVGKIGHRYWKVVCGVRAKSAEVFVVGCLTVGDGV